MTESSEFDNLHIPLAREFIEASRSKFIQEFVSPDSLVCDIGTQGKPILRNKPFKLVTIDIDEANSPDILADITVMNQNISDGHFDYLMCTEVLEHVVDPFSAVRELRRIVKVGGYLLFTTPLNARIHGPIPDCWRFTEFGLNVLFRDLELVHFDKLPTPGRNLFPLHYAAIVRNVGSYQQESDARNLTFSPVN
jgi:hypothetical protein